MHPDDNIEIKFKAMHVHNIASISPHLVSKKLCSYQMKFWTLAAWLLWRIPIDCMFLIVLTIPYCPFTPGLVILSDWLNEITCDTKIHGNNR